MTKARRRYDLLKGRLNRFSRLAGGIDRGDARAIHGTRVASRRLRELLPVLQLEAASADKLGRQLRRLTKGLGKLRELDVLLQQLEKLQLEGRPGAPALESAVEAVREDRARAYRRATSKPIESGLRRLDRQLHKIADGLEDGDNRRTARRWVWAIDARVVRRAFTLRRAMERAGTMYWPKRLHAVRIGIKKLRYGLELSLEASGSPDLTDLRTLRRGQDLLGRLHDLQILIERVRKVQASGQRRNVQAWHEFDAFVGSLEDDCRRLHARYIRARPAIVAICDRLAAPTLSTGTHIQQAM